jgi:hypothetical protein
MGMLLWVDSVSERAERVLVYRACREGHIGRRLCEGQIRRGEENEQRIKLINRGQSC